MKVLIATKNSGKIEGAKRALERYFDNVEIEGIAVSSDVKEQPVNEEICEGVKNRVNNLKMYAKENNIKADLYLAIESGIARLFGHWMIINFSLIEDNDSFESYGMGPAFPVPDRLVDKIIDTDLSKVADEIFCKDENRHNSGGMIKLLSKDAVSRIDLTESAFIMAITKYINKDTWN